jgi:hypothetical protein
VGGLAIIHDRGDQMIFAGLVANVAARGPIAGYTIRGIDDTGMKLLPDRELVLRVFQKSPDAEGPLLHGLVASGERYWDAPLANQPPVFPALLLASHALLGQRDDGFPLLGRSPFFAEASHLSPEQQGQWETALVARTVHDPPAGAVRAQLWASILPLLSDLLTTALLYALGRRLLGSSRAGIVAAALFAADPLALFAAHRILSNATLATACLAVVWSWASAEERSGSRRTASFALAGGLAGLAILVKVSAVFLLPAGVVALLPRRRLADLAAFLGAGALVAGPWLLLQWRVLGNPLGLAWQQQQDWAATSSWAHILLGRGPGYYAAILGHSPLLCAGIVGAGWLTVKTLRGAATTAGFAGAFALLVLAAAQFHSGGKEARHLLHVYPLLALAAASGLEPLRRRARALGFDRRASDLVLVTLLVLLLGWQARTGLDWAYATAAPP